MHRIDIEITPGETFSLTYPAACKSIVSLIAEVKKKVMQAGVADYNLTPLFSITGDNDDILLLEIPDTSFMEDWEQWAYDIRAVDEDGNIFYPFYGLIYRRGGVPPRRDADVPS